MTTEPLYDRLQRRRTERYLRRAQRHGHRFPRWRTRARRRTLVAVLAALLAALIGAGLWTYSDAPTAYTLVLVVILAFLALWTMLQIVSARGDAPRDALDEYELALRDRARSIGLTVTQCVAVVPAVALMVLGQRHGLPTRLAYTGGLLVIVALVIGSVTPTVILAWTRPEPDVDPDLEDL